MRRKEDKEQRRSIHGPSPRGALEGLTQRGWFAVRADPI